MSPYRFCPSRANRNHAMSPAAPAGLLRHLSRACQRRVRRTRSAQVARFLSAEFFGNDVVFLGYFLSEIHSKLMQTKVTVRRSIARILLNPGRDFRPDRSCDRHLHSSPSTSRSVWPRQPHFYPTTSCAWATHAQRIFVSFGTICNRATPCLPIDNQLLLTSAHRRR
jgi:hypothetical protein